MSTSGVALQVVNLSKQFLDKIIFENVNFEIERGQVVSLLGRSGSGKSTILKILMALDKNYSGLVKIETPKIGYLFQEPVLLNWWTLRQNINLPNLLNTKDKILDSSKLEQVIHSVGLKEEAFKYPAEVSGGMKMRATIARTLLTDPELLLLDEPYGSLDELTKNEIQNYIQKFSKEKNISILFVTHSIHDAIKFSDKILILNSKNIKTLKNDFKDNKVNSYSDYYSFIEGQL